MKLDFVAPVIESSGDFQSEKFKIDEENMAMILDILRNRMYSDPIAAICREVACNARDSHREAGKPELPIHIQLPTFLAPQFIVKDFGVGISPERMVNIFIKYAASTKRSDNNQTGGFGLGAKTPFAYSDSFSIVTVFNGIKYHYTCLIDETRVGKIALLNKENTDECNGTEIQVPVKKNDFDVFRIKTIEAVRYWDIKPILSGTGHVLEDENVVISGNDWFLSNKNSRKINCLVDGICYEVSSDHRLEPIGSYTSTFLKFKVGEISLAANRESVNIDEKTINTIRLKLLKVNNDLKESFQKEVNEQESIVDAYIKYAELRQSIFTYKTPPFSITHWRDIPLPTSNLMSFSKGTTSYYVRHGSYRHMRGNKKVFELKTYQNNEFDIRTPAFINDINQHLFNEKLQKIADELKDGISIIYTNDLQKFLVENQDVIDLYKIEMLSSVYDISTDKKTRREAVDRTIVFQPDSSNRESWSMVKASEINQKRKQIVLRLTQAYDKSKYADGVEQPFKGFSSLSAVVRLLNSRALKEEDKYVIYGVYKTVSTEKINKLFKNKTTQTHVFEEICTKENWAEISWLIENEGELEHKSNILAIGEYMDRECIESKFTKHYEVYKNVCKTKELYLDIVRQLPSGLTLHSERESEFALKYNKANDFGYKEIISSYPLLSVLFEHYGRYSSFGASAYPKIVEYIKLMDSINSTK